MTASKQVTLKLLCLGDSAVGKSNLLTRYTDNKFAQDYISTIGVDFKLKTLNIGGRSVRVQLWDTAGQERFRTIQQAYYRGAHGVLLVYDITNERSFNNVRRWADDVERQTAGDEGVSTVRRVLVGNKSDLVDDRVIDAARGQALATDLCMAFFETSAKTGDGVEQAFQALIADVYQRLYGTTAAGTAAAPPTSVGDIVKLTESQKARNSAAAASKNDNAAEKPCCA
jgi:small GTP-binding protein